MDEDETPRFLLLHAVNSIAIITISAMMLSCFMLSSPFTVRKNVAHLVNHKQKRAIALYTKKAAARSVDFVGHRA